LLSQLRTQRAPQCLNVFRPVLVQKLLQPLLMRSHIAEAIMEFVVRRIAAWALTRRHRLKLL
jgi:hypothetical protein